MSFLKRAIQKGISEGIGKAVGEAVTKVVEPKATELANKAAKEIDKRTEMQRNEAKEAFSGLESAFADLEKAAKGYATEMGKNMKICPSCGKPSEADKIFCPECGTKLPEQTVAEGAVCTNCGKQNDIGTKFCSDCGTKLPAAVMEEEVAAKKDADTLISWDTYLPAYPKWNCGGKDYCIEDLDGGFVFNAQFEGDHNAAQKAVKDYRILLQENGFTVAGKYPGVEHLYKMVDGNCCHVDTEHCFESDPDCITLYFNIAEPTGGFDYKEPEPEKPMSLKEGLSKLKGLFD